jgi:formylglycine-generating enzyme required for sulfatase activity
MLEGILSLSQGKSKKPKVKGETVACSTFAFCRLPFPFSLILGCFLIFVLISTSVESRSATPQTAMPAYAEAVPGANVKIEMVPIPAGFFLMGSPQGEPGRAAEEGPQHEVALGAFWMSAMEITWDQYDPFAFSLDLRKERSPSQTVEPKTTADAVTRPTPPYADESFGYGKGDQPAISMTHHAAMEFCRWLSAKTGKTYRLPTEAEWEYACRAGSKSAYSFGPEAKQIGEYGWFLDNSDGAPHPVGKKKPNAWGLYDMHGNVAEWCIDHYEKNFYAQFTAPARGPVLLPTDKRYQHVARGGSWDDEASLLRSAARRGSNPSWSRRDPQSPQSIWWHTDATTVGFRIVRPLEEQENLKGLKSKVTRQSS